MDPINQTNKNSNKVVFITVGLLVLITLSYLLHRTFNPGKMIGNLNDSTMYSDNQRNSTPIPVIPDPTSAPVYSQETYTSIPEYTGDEKSTPRIAYWYGKVNQHWNLTTASWETDSDGVSGANIDKLLYCLKYYPNTSSVTPYKEEFITDWKARGNTSNYELKVLTERCIQK